MPKNRSNDIRDDIPERLPARGPASWQRTRQQAEQWTGRHHSPRSWPLFGECFNSG